ncbi:MULTISPECIES: diaminopimelate epimerase [Caulobacter]|jgi:diaminopimelate epimerase|uniref:Diaminopimelate epimerase n=1 Tax=Caulobacter vibrioides OR37 TaxID=1292034 RepID=R0D2D8_CAUVI|nr:MULTISPECIES: diaminopimelate epimerase [Caulobacter]ENZ82786.1 diaminopimelate epimerase [Caulobacter vibrioides OR37]MBQ1559537.1 diaminopimelate epimerase [Caulobacter sp.]
MSRNFLKMNGLGNDFVVIETATQTFEPTPEQIRAIAKRGDGGIGCDQVIAIDPPRAEGASAYVRFWNADGEPAGACGNGTRCVAWLLMRSAGKTAVAFDTVAGRLSGLAAGEMLVTVDMGRPGLDWTQIPLSEEMNTERVELQVGPIDAPWVHTPVCVSMGNPHVVFFVDAPVSDEFATKTGSLVEHHPLFPEGVNVGFAHIAARDHIQLKVWERGAGLTAACGTGACAAQVAAVRRGLTDRQAKVEFERGALTIEWRESDGHVIMTGPVSMDFVGKLPEALAA